MGDAISRLLKWAPGNVAARVSTFQRSAPVAASRQNIQPPVSAKYTAPSATSADEKIPASDAAARSFSVTGAPSVGGSTAWRAGLRYTQQSVPCREIL